MSIPKKRRPLATAETTAAPAHYFDAAPAVGSKPRKVHLHVGEILDLGSGYGPIAIAIARRSPEANVWAVDINQRALELTIANAATARVTNVTVASPDQVPEHVRFAAIFSNPPVRVGKAALHELLLKWLPRLQPGGHAYLVVQRNLGADSLSAWLATQGFEVNRLKAKKGYRVLEVTSPTP